MLPTVGKSANDDDGEIGGKQKGVRSLLLSNAPSYPAILTPVDTRSHSAEVKSQKESEKEGERASVARMEEERLLTICLFRR